MPRAALLSVRSRSATPDRGGSVFDLDPAHKINLDGFPFANVRAVSAASPPGMGPVIRNVRPSTSFGNADTMLSPAELNPNSMIAGC
jgi:hypothetical protein